MKHKFIKSKKAQAMVEFALILPIVIVTIGILFTGGEMLFTKMALQMAAYEGARAGVTMPDASQGSTEARNKVKSFVSEKAAFIDSNNLVINAIDTSGAWKKGQPFKVTVSYDLPTPFPIPNTKWTNGSTSTITGEIQLAIENGN